MAQFLDGGVWRKATGSAFDRIMREERTARRLRASERTRETARARSAKIRALKAEKSEREYKFSVLKILRDLGLAPGAKAWGRLHRIRVRKAPESSSRKDRTRSPRPSVTRAKMPKYRKAIRDARGRVAVFLQMSYLGLKSKGWRPGLPADHAEYCQRQDALEEPEIQRKSPVSNIAETPQECSAVWKALEPVEKGYRANAKVQFRVVGNLPYHFTPEQRRAVMEDFGELAFGRYGLGYMAFCHLPDENGDERNFHFHLLATTRPVVRVGDHEWAIGEEKLTELFTPEGMKRIRAIYAAVLNRHCRKNGLEERFTHQNYQDRGIDAFRTEKIGPARMAAFEAGENVAVVERNRSRIMGNEAAVEAQLLQRKFSLQRRLATSISLVADMAKMAKKIGGLREQVRMIGEAVEAVQTSMKSPRSMVKLRLAEGVGTILQWAERSRVEQKFPLNSGCRNATIQLASHASSIASRNRDRGRNGVDLTMCESGSLISLRA